jgi:hypothetical protein
MTQTQVNLREAGNNVDETIESEGVGSNEVWRPSKRAAKSEAAKQKRAKKSVPGRPAPLKKKMASVKKGVAPSSRGLSDVSRALNRGAGKYIDRSNECDRERKLQAGTDRQCGSLQPMTQSIATSIGLALDGTPPEVIDAVAAEASGMPAASSPIAQSTAIDEAAREIVDLYRPTRCSMRQATKGNRYGASG